jgi:hypothetical protein
MASEILGLFTSPEQYRAAQDQQTQNAAIQYAGMSPFQRADVSLYTGGRQLGNAVGSLFGMEDPQLRKISMRQQMLTGAGGGPRINLNDPGSMLRAANVAQEQGDPEFAQYLIGAANDLAKNIADMRSKSATAAKTELSIAQEEKLRDELSNLGPTPTNEQVLAVVSKYGSPEKIMGVLQATQTAQAGREARKEETTLRLEQQSKIEQEKIQAKKEAAEAEAERKRQAALEAAKNQRERDAINNQNKIEQERIRQEAKSETRALIEASKPPKTLSASLQKDETANLENIDKYDAQIKALEAPINNLTPDPKTKKPLLELGPVDNLFNYGRNLLSQSNEKSRAFEELKSAIDTAVNIKVSAEKGVQTDKDVVRQANALIAASGKNDTKATRQALIRFRDAIKTDKEKTQKIIESRRKSQGVEPYYSSSGSKAIDFNDIGR